jgi:hypothetical protein
MRYPKLLSPDGTEAIKLPSGNIVDVPKARPQFQAWSGETILDTYGKKPVLNSDGLPAFAEIRILRLCQQDGWTGVWVDTFGRKFRTEFWPKNEIQLPSQEKKLLEKIYRKAGGRKGCWDVFCWKGADHLWAESKLRRHDSIRPAQEKWLYAALECGLPLSSFLIVEWSLEK